MRAVFPLVLALTLAVVLSAQTSPTITGEYVEARSGEVYTCGCLYSGEQVSSGREAILAWKIREGEVSGISLAGVKMAAVIVGQGHLGLATSRRQSSVYVDSASSAAQQQAGVELLQRRYADLLGPIHAVHVAPISFQQDNEWTYVRIGETVEVVVRPARIPEDAHPGSLLWYDPFVAMKQPVLANISYFRFWGQDFNQQWWTRDLGITGFMGDFVLAP